MSAVGVLIADPLAQSLALIVLTSVFFLLFPGIDPWFSGLFYNSDVGFAFGRAPLSGLLRTLASDVTIAIVVALLASLIAKLAMPQRPSFIAPRDALFLIGTLIVGPGLVVNAIFKDHWGRPRPNMVGMFGGGESFVGVWRISDACTSNCSFVSGEASSAAWLLATVVLLPARWRPLGLKILLGVAIVLSLNRIAAGGHFLSDVLLAWWITLAIIAVAYRLLYLTPSLVTGEQMEAGMTRAGDAIRAGIRRLAHPPT